MLVTALEPKKKGLCALYLDGEYAMKLDAETLLSHRVDVGAALDDDALHALVLASDLKRCKDKAMWLLSFRDHSAHELSQKLRRDYSEEAAEQTVERCKELGLLDDARYARRLSADLVHLKGLSRSGVRQKLLQKGIDRELIDEVLEDIEIDETEQIRNILEKKYARFLSDEKGRRRAVNALLRLGYAYQDVKSVLREFTEDEW